MIGTFNLKSSNGWNIVNSFYGYKLGTPTAPSTMHIICSLTLALLRLARPTDLFSALRLGSDKQAAADPNALQAACSTHTHRHP